MDKEDENPKKKIDFVQALFMMIIAVIADLIGFVLVLFALDDFGIIELVLAPLYTAWFYFNGAGWSRALPANILEAIPYVSALPLYSVLILYSIYTANHPKKSKSVGLKNKITRLIKK